jgi:hypothetical protein
MTRAFKAAPASLPASARQPTMLSGQTLHTGPVATLSPYFGPYKLQQLAFGQRVGSSLMTHCAVNTKVRQPIIQRIRINALAAC